MALQTVLEKIDRDVDAATSRLLTFLSIASISTDPAYQKECDNAADWLVGQLREIGFEASKRPTSGHPMVLARSPGADGNKSKLFYGHYDVQPVDPISEWDHPPFEPFIDYTPNSGGAVIRGRGASDDKGQLMTFIEACRVWKSVTGSVPSNLKFLFEGEEESGSPSLVPFLETNADELVSEIALICDTGLFDHDTPSIVLMLRGLLGEEVIITGPNQDLHSGLYGGIAMNPLRVLNKILAGLHDKQNRVTLPGFYDGIVDPSAKMLAQWKQLVSDPAQILAPIGLSEPAGELDRSPLELNWSRPCCDVNGVQGGYCGDGFKTVIPAKASAKVSFRLVNGQNPAEIRKQFRQYVRSLIPADCSVSFKEHGASAASCFSVNHEMFKTVRDSLSAEWPTEAVFIGGGGSIPIAGHFKSILGIESVLAGFGLDNDRIHSPNEKYDLRSFHLGMRTWARVLNSLS